MHIQNIPIASLGPDVGWLGALLLSQILAAVDLSEPVSILRFSKVFFAGDPRDEQCRRNHVFTDRAARSALKQLLASAANDEYPERAIRLAACMSHDSNIVAVDTQRLRKALAAYGVEPHAKEPESKARATKKRLVSKTAAKAASFGGLIVKAKRPSDASLGRYGLVEDVDGIVHHLVSECYGHLKGYCDVTDKWLLTGLAHTHLEEWCQKALPEIRPLLHNDVDGAAGGGYFSKWLTARSRAGYSLGGRTASFRSSAVPSANRCCETDFWYASLAHACFDVLGRWPIGPTHVSTAHSKAAYDHWCSCIGDHLNGNDDAQYIACVARRWVCAGHSVLAYVAADLPPDVHEAFLLWGVGAVPPRYTAQLSRVFAAQQEVFQQTAPGGLLLRMPAFQEELACAVDIHLAGGTA